MPGYWWECSHDPTHRLDTFHKAQGSRLVDFMYLLAATDWDQAHLTVPCPLCEPGVMRITYAFPRRDSPVEISVHRIVGLTGNLPHYLPMMWEGIARGEAGPWFDFKYVGWSDSTGQQAYGLARPAVFNRDELRELFALYRQRAGASSFP